MAVFPGMTVNIANCHFESQGESHQYDCLMSPSKQDLRSLNRSVQT